MSGPLSYGGARSRPVQAVLVLGLVLSILVLALLLGGGAPACLASVFFLFLLVEPRRPPVAAPAFLALPGPGSKPRVRAPPFLA